MLVNLILLTTSLTLAFSFPEHSFSAGSCNGKTENEDWEPLFFTPFIIANETKEARQKALVNFTDCINSGAEAGRVWDITSYSGFFTVFPEGVPANYFVWYFPPMNKTNDVDAVIVWLQGGPGSSSLYGLFAENGPIFYKDDEIGVRRVNWAQNYHMIYVDNPVGTGFSFTDYPEVYCRNETQVAKNLLETLVQFYEVFPELREHMLFITGESYAGKYVPALGEAIFNWNSASDFKLNLSGLMIGNGFSDPENQIVYDQYLYQLGLVDTNQAKILQKYQDKTIQYIRAKEWDKAYAALGDLVLGGRHGSVFSNVTGFNFPYNFLHTQNYDNNGIYEFLSNDCFKKRIHVGNLTYSDGVQVWNHLKNDIPKSMAITISFLLNHYYVVFYNGQLDLLVPYVGTVNFLSKLNFTGVENLDTAPRLKWMVGDELAGYVKHVGKMVQVLVRNAGHMVPLDQPEWALDMVDRTVRMCARSAVKSSMTGNFLTNNFNN